MDIITIPFEESFTVKVDGHDIKLVTFRTQEHGNVKFGVDAPRSVNVHREEIYLAIKQKIEAEQQALIED